MKLWIDKKLAPPDESYKAVTNVYGAKMLILQFYNTIYSIEEIDMNKEFVQDLLFWLRDKNIPIKIHTDSNLQ